MNTYEWVYVSELNEGDCLSDGSRVLHTTRIGDVCVAVSLSNHTIPHYRPSTTVRVWDYPPTAVDLAANVEKERVNRW